MNEEQKLKLFIGHGFRYNSDTGEILSPKNKVISAKSNGYINCSLRHNNKVLTCSAHRLAYFIYYNQIPKEIDHIDRDRSNNKIENLRSVSRQQNNFNLEAKGYSYQKSRNKFIAYITKDGKKINLGRFDLEEDARKAYLNAKEKLHTIL